MTVEECKERYGIKDIGGYVNCMECPLYVPDSPTLRDCCGYAEKYYLICNDRETAWSAIADFMSEERK